MPDTPQHDTIVKPSPDVINIYDAGIFRRMRKIYAEKGAGFLLRKTGAFAWRSLYARTLLRFGNPRIFIFRNENYRYFYHQYNYTWANERAVEVPIVMGAVQAFRTKNVLEFGCVLPHYYEANWDVLDKFERGPNIISRDVIDFMPAEKYDFIMSISTLEHAGYDDTARNPDKVIDVLEHLKQNCLAPGGSMIFTMPLGYNSFMDERLYSDRLGFDELFFLKRINGGEWQEIHQDELGEVAYATKYIEAAAIVVAEYTAEK